MMKFPTFTLVCGMLGGFSAYAVELSSGIELQYLDHSVRPQDDFYRYINGKWLDATVIPADKSSYDSFDIVYDKTQDQLHTIVNELTKSQKVTDAEQVKIVNLYASFMDEPALEERGGKPLAAEFARINALQKIEQVPALIAHLNRIGVTAPYVSQVHQDAKDSSKYVFDIGQAGLGMPDRDYYLGAESQLVKTRAQYAEHIERMLKLSDNPAARQNALAIVKLEHALAKIQWSKVELRDPVKAYNKYEFAKLSELAPSYNWQAYLDEAGVKGRTNYLVVSQPSYIHGFNQLLRSTPLSVWREYFRWHVLSYFAPYLNKAFVDEHFAFYGVVLTGAEHNRVRWKRSLELIDSSMGEALGKLYVAAYFPPAARDRIEQLVKNLLAAYHADIGVLDWMGPETKLKADEKLAKFTAKIGYPTRWRDYALLEIKQNDLFGNVRRAAEFEYQRNINKLGQPIDRNEWDMTPQTVNAYYNPERNEIVFPAAILQPPFFNAEADDAVNYGGIGAVIGHEISHGFDDQGSQYDGTGNLLSAPGWFKAEDLVKFKAKSSALVTQYSAYSPVPGYPVNGELTLGENIADNSGLSIAYKAYKLSSRSVSPPIIDGMSGAQRFFMGYAQVWRGKTRDAAAILYIKSDPHSPDKFRGLLPEMNQEPFDEAFSVKPGDKMYRSAEQRVSMW